MNKYLRVAGLAMEWSQHYAKTFAKYLEEIGYTAKRITAGGHELVVYSYRPFAFAEAEEAIAHLDAIFREGEQ
jgi:hypothetical protein